MNQKRKVWAMLLVAVTPLQSLLAFTANQVTYEIHPWFYRIHIEYTIPALKQLRVALYETPSQEKASEFYWQLVRGGEFEVNKEGKVIFPAKENLKPDPW